MTFGHDVTLVRVSMFTDHAVTCLGEDELAPRVGSGGWRVASEGRCEHAVSSRQKTKCPRSHMQLHQSKEGAAENGSIFIY